MPILAVAPHWGAWIEITTVASRALRRLVAPHWGAWIEIRETLPFIISQMSHPTGVRGLKYIVNHHPTSGMTSHPTGVRGLK